MRSSFHKKPDRHIEAAARKAGHAVAELVARKLAGAPSIRRGGLHDPAPIDREVRDDA